MTSLGKSFPPGTRPRCGHVGPQSPCDGAVRVVKRRLLWLYLIHKLPGLPRDAGTSTVWLVMMLLLQVLLLGCVALHLSESSAVQALYEPPYLSSDHHSNDNDISDADDSFPDFAGQTTTTSDPDDLGIAFRTRAFGKKGAWAPYTHAVTARGFGNKRGMGNKRGFGNKRGGDGERYAAIEEMLERLHQLAEREGELRYGSQEEGGEAGDVSSDVKRGFGNKRASVRHRGEDIVFWWPRSQQS